MKQYDDVHRTLAALAWCKCPEDIKAAAAHFKDSLTIMGVKDCPSDDKDFIRRWVTSWKQHKHLKGQSSNSGRKEKVSHELIEQLLEAMTNWKKAGREGPYASLSEVLAANPNLKEAVDKAGASLETVRNSLKRYCPNLVYKNLFIKQKLTDRHKHDRYRRAYIKLYESVIEDEKLLERVVWIDAKTMYMTVKSRRGWVLSGKEDIFETYHPASEKNPITLKYYIAVNYRVGKLKLIWYTGTTGMPADRDPDNPYLVSPSPLRHMHDRLAPWLLC